MSRSRTLRVGIDVGGTFTDLVAVESWSGERLTRKVASTPREPHRAVVEALAALLAGYDDAPALEFLAHSTTIATNALLGQLGLELPRVALVTTRGFRDVIEIGRQNRNELYNLFVQRPRPLVAREDRIVVTERLDHRGNVLVALEPSEIARTCEEVAAHNVAAVAICLRWPWYLLGLFDNTAAYLFPNDFTVVYDDPIYGSILFQGRAFGWAGPAFTAAA